MSLTAYTALMQQALQALDGEPALAQRLLDRAARIQVPRHAVLQRAWAVLVSRQLAWSRGDVQRGRVAEIFEAARVFQANDLYDEHVRALALAAHLAAVQGDVALALRTSIRAFRDVRAAPEHRLLAARAILWNVPPEEDRAAGRLLAEVRGLAASAPASTGKAMACAYLAYRDFRRILFHAGIPTDTEPYPPPATMTREAARAAVQRLVEPLDEQLDDLRARLPAEPVPLLFVAAMHGFVRGSASCVTLAREVERRCGAAVDAYVSAVIGAAHLRNGEHEPALEHLLRSWQVFVARDRADEGRPWLFHLSLALRANKRWREALETMDRFLASAPRIEQPWRRTALIVEALHDDAGLPPADEAGQPTVLHSGSRPPYVKLALKWMNERLAHRIRVPDIVAAVGVSRRTLEVGFRTYRNRTLAEELRWMRMHRALDLLRSPGVRLGDVRSQVGYTSASAFSRDFRRVFGVLPTRAGDLVDIDVRA